MQTEAQKRATKKYSEKCRMYRLKYYPHEEIETKALDALLGDLNTSVNAYLKYVVRKDLKERGYLDANY